MQPDIKLIALALGIEQTKPVLKLLVTWLKVNVSDLDIQSIMAGNQETINRIKDSEEFHGLLGDISVKRVMGIHSNMNKIAIALGLEQTKPVLTLFSKWLPSGVDWGDAGKILAGDKETINRIKDSPEFDELEKKITALKKPKKITRKCSGPEDTIRLALWFIRTVGCPDKAVAAVKGAAETYKAIS